MPLSLSLYAALLVAGCSEVARGRLAHPGMKLSAVDELGNRITVRIDSVELDPLDPDGEVHLYTVLSRDEQTGDWKNLCALDHEGQAKAIPLSGSWTTTGDYVASDEVMTFACTQGVIAKCVRWGYKPWKEVRGKSLRDFHQACVHMARADYCGNGMTHTRDGTRVGIYDTLGIRKRHADSGMAFEAAWSPSGAVYVNRTRWGEKTTDIRQTCPERLSARVNEGASVHGPEAIPGLMTEALIFNDSFVQNPH